MQSRHNDDLRSSLHDDLEICLIAVPTIDCPICLCLKYAGEDKPSAELSRPIG